MSTSPTSPSHTPFPLVEARQRIIEAIASITAEETVPLEAAYRRVLARAITSRVNVPSATNSSMDGYALAAGDAPDGLVYEQIGESFAGHPYTGPLSPGQCVRIMTGAVVPDGADRVVIQEDVTAEARRIRLEALPEAGSNIRPAGEDIAVDDTILAAGRYLRPADIAVLASIGQAEVPVIRRPRVAFFSTGDELRPIDGPLDVGGIYDSNRYGLAAMIESLGFIGVDLGAIGDDPDALAAAFEQAGDCDALITTGGVSVGDADHVVDVLKRVGEIDFWKVAIKPGKPLAVGAIGNTRFFGLPGNPVSTAVTFLQLVRPALVTLAGGTPAPALRLTLPTMTALSKRGGREHYLRARIETEGEAPGVTALDHQGSGVMRSMSQADAFIVLGADTEAVAAGDSVVVEPFAQAVWR